MLFEVKCNRFTYDRSIFKMGDVVNIADDKAHTVFFHVQRGALIPIVSGSPKPAKGEKTEIPAEQKEALKNFDEERKKEQESLDFDGNGVIDKQDFSTEKGKSFAARTLAKSRHSKNKK